MIPREPLFHFLKQLDFIFIACRIGKSCDDAAVIEFPVLKAAGKPWEFIVGNQPALGVYFFYFKLFHISCPFRPAAALNLLLKSKISGFIFIDGMLHVKLAAVQGIKPASRVDCLISYALQARKIKIQKKPAKCSHLAGFSILNMR